MRTERAVFDTFAPEIAAQVGRGCVLIDLGAGNCEKAERLFGWLAPSQYVAVDIAAGFLRERLDLIAGRHPALAIIGIAQDFTAKLELPPPLHSEAPVFHPDPRSLPRPTLRSTSWRACVLRSATTANCCLGSTWSRTNGCSTSPMTIRSA
jgi:hypothetical protein